MTDEELERILDPVREYHKALQVTPNTVLAAHLRALGVHPVGDTWRAAKALMDRGVPIDDAARIAVRSSPHADDEDAFVPTESLSESEHEEVEQAGNSISRTRQGAPTGQSVEIYTQQRSSEPVELNAPSEHFGAPPTRSTNRLHRRSHFQQPDLDGRRMNWFPKVFGPGDIDGKGASRLLGTPNVPLSTVLVRETAQNSWDARIGTMPVTFALHLRRLNDVERRVLREQVFTGAATGLTLLRALEEPGLRVLEVSDRGTKGLGGPTQNDVEPPLGAATDYIDLILNIGAPRDVHLGAGTYGFGKTISYRVSRAGTILIWSRSVEEGKVEDRLIGSAIGESFALDGKRHTGRHWWGDPRGDHRIDPWRGVEAAAMGRGVFDAAFRGDETGTSIMIIDPDLGGEDDAEDIERLADAIMWNLWPKLLPDTRGDQPMHIELYADGHRVPLPSVTEHPILAGHAEALQLARATQNGDTFSPRFNTKVHEVWCLRPKTLVGHLGITRYPRTEDVVDGRMRDTIPVTSPSSHVAWMRHDAELVVRYDERPRLDSENLQWAGVFKPVGEHDDAFASAEPPAHDDWVAASIEDKHNRRIVNVALRRIGELIGTELAPPSAAQDGNKPARSVAVLADSLSRLIGATPGSKAERRPTQRSSASRPRKPQAQIIRWQRGEVVDGYRTIALLVGVKNATDRVSVTADVGVATDGARMHEPEFVDVLGWKDALDSEATTLDATFEPNDQRWLVIRAAAGVGVDASVSCTEVQS